MSLKNCFNSETYGGIVKENHVELCFSDEWVVDSFFFFFWTDSLEFVRFIEISFRWTGKPINSYSVSF